MSRAKPPWYRQTLSPILALTVMVALRDKLVSTATLKRVEST